MTLQQNPYYGFPPQAAAVAAPPAQVMNQELVIFHGTVQQPCCWCCPAPTACAVKWEVTSRRVDYKRPCCCCCCTQASTAQVRNIKDVDYNSCCCTGVVTVHMKDPKETLRIEGFGEKAKLKTIYDGLRKAVGDLKVHLVGGA